MPYTSNANIGHIKVIILLQNKVSHDFLNMCCVSQLITTNAKCNVWKDWSRNCFMNLQEAIRRNALLLNPFLSKLGVVNHKINVDNLRQSTND